MRGSIIAGRLMVLGSCIGFLVLMGVGETSAEEGGGESNWIRVLILGTLVLLACVEKIASVANLVAMERDWVVVMTEGLEEKLRGGKSFCEIVACEYIRKKTDAKTIRYQT